MNVTGCPNNYFTYCIFDQNVSDVLKEKSVQDLKHQNGTFIWFQLLIEILLRMRQTSDAKLIC